MTDHAPGVVLHVRLNLIRLIRDTGSGPDVYSGTGTRYGSTCAQKGS